MKKAYTHDVCADETEKVGARIGLRKISRSFKNSEKFSFDQFKQFAED